MRRKIGICYEDKYLMEKRVPLIPLHVQKLVESGVEVQIVPSKKRIFKDEEYVVAGAQLKKDLDASVILGVKEMPLNYFKKYNTYLFFSHTVKGQSYNMPLLKNMIESKINLIDYERITNDQGKRLIFFGRFAGLAGMINSLWSLGQRLKIKGIETPFLNLQQAHHYNSLEEAKSVVSAVGWEITEKGFPNSLKPLVIGITGYGNVSKGAQEILGLLPTIEITPAELNQLQKQKRLSSKAIYKVVFKEKDLARPKIEGEDFDLQEYYQHPEEFKGVFEKYLPHLTVLMNCIYWDKRYPRIVTKAFLEKEWKQDNFQLEVIGDISCDLDGSVEITHKETTIEDPVFVYNPLTRQPVMGFQGEGILIMAVDILPSELPRESSVAFSNVLVRLLPLLVTADMDVPFEDLQITAPLKKALILHQGALTPHYVYLKGGLK